MKRIPAASAGSALAAAAFFCLCLFTGAADIPAGAVVGALFGHSGNAAWDFIVVDSRLVQAAAATLGGAALSAAGLMLQTCFANPLADTSILGVNAGASLGAAIALMLIGGTAASVSGYALTLVAALAGAAAVLVLLSALAAVLRGSLMLLIAGVMVSYVVSAIISVLSSLATAEGVRQYVFWGMGDFGGVTRGAMPVFAAVTAAGLAGALMLVKPLDAMLLGDDYARNLGIHTKSARLKILAVTGVLGATVTAFCGPVAFLGLAVPHVARFLAGTVSHRKVMPLAMLCGAAVALICDFACAAAASRGLFVPLNAVMSLWGVPVALYVLAFGRRRNMFD